MSGERDVRVIFVDIDDVINSDRLIASCPAFDDEVCPPALLPVNGDPVALALLNRAAETCGARFVASSSWIYALGWGFTRTWLIDSGLEPLLFHDDPHVPYGSTGDKSEAIANWLGCHPEVLADHVCVVDDDPDLFPPADDLARRQVIVDGPDGLLLRHFNQIVEKLGPKGGKS